MDSARFKELFLPYYQRIYQVAFKLLGNSEDAEDIVQETYIKLWERRDELSHVRNAEAFCTVITRNLCLDKIRSVRYDTASTDDERIALPDDETPSDIVERKDHNRLLYGLIDRLPDMQKKLILLHDANGYTFDEIEKITGLTPINIRVTLSRARKKLREQFMKHTAYGE